MVGVLEIFLVRTHGRVPEDGVFQGPVRTHRRVPEAEFQGLRFLAAQLFCQEDCFSGLLEFFYGSTVFSNTCFKLCGFFLIGIAFF